MERISLTYDPDMPTRLWMVGDGFELVRRKMEELCQEVYRFSCVPDSRWSTNNIFYLDIANPSVSFNLFDTDSYPPDGYTGIFLRFHDFVPGPWGNLGYMSGTAPVFAREFTVHCGSIVHNPTHGENNYSQTIPPRLRPSKFEEHFGFSAAHIFSFLTPTVDFTFTLNSNSLAGVHILGFLDFAGAVRVRLDWVTALPSYRHHFSDPRVSLQKTLFFEQEFDSERELWRGFVNASVKTGYWTSESRKIYLE